jgi:hypothetical protein
MMSPGQFTAALGFAFVAIWIGFDFAAAILCLVGALVFYLGGVLLLGQLDLADLQNRLRTNLGQPPPPRPPTPPRAH